MKINHQHIAIVIAVFFSATIIACQKKGSSYKKIEPAHIETIEGNKELHLVTLTEKAVERIDIKTDQVKQIAATDGETQKVVHYGSILYDAHGKTWVYKNPEPLNYVRHEVVVDYIDGNEAYLKDGPAVGTQVVIQGAAELLGTEYEVGH